MPLTLVTGPANAAKAGEVLGGLRARLEDQPILVVPGFADVDHAQRELAERGAVFGASVLRFEWLYREIARRAGHSARVASDIQRELIVEGAVRRAELAVLAESAAQPGFVHAAARFVTELGRSMVEPARLTRALRDWAGDGPRRALRRGGGRDLPRLPRRARVGRARRRRSCSPGARSTRCAASPGAGAPRRCSSTASTTSIRSSATRSRRSPATAGPT